MAFASRIMRARASGAAPAPMPRRSLSAILRSSCGIVRAVDDPHRAVADALENHVTSDVRADGQVGLARLDRAIDSVAPHSDPLAAAEMVPAR